MAVLVEALTDNRNRTVSELKMIFKSHGGNMGEVGSVAWMFDRVGVIEGKKNPLPDDVEGEAIEVGAQDVESYGNGVVGFTTDPKDLEQVRSSLIGRGWELTLSELGFHAKTPVTLDGDAKKEAVEFLQELSSHDDVRRVHATLK